MIRVFKLSCILLSIMNFGCNDSDHLGYSKLHGSIHYKLVAIGDDGLKVEDGEYTSVEIKVRVDSVLSAHKSYSRVRVHSQPFPSYLLNLLAEATGGDSMLISGSAGELELNQMLGKELFKSDTLVHLEVMVKEVFTDSLLRHALAKERTIKDFELKEKSDLRKVLDSLDITTEHLVDGVYLKALNNPSDKPVSKGDFVSTNYILSLANGREVANTYKSEPFEYQTGKPGQVITGFGVGVYNMNYGGEYLLVVSSNLGFGAQGSSSEIIPPYSVLIYEVKLLDQST